MHTCSADLALVTLWRPDSATVSCRGRILHGTTATRFGERVWQLLRRHGRVVVDLSGVTQMDARGLGVLAMLIRKAGGRPNGRLVLVTTGNRVGRLLRLSRLDTYVACVSVGAPPASNVGRQLKRAYAAVPA